MDLLSADEGKQCSPESAEIKGTIRAFQSGAERWADGLAVGEEGSRGNYSAGINMNTIDLLTVTESVCAERGCHSSGAKFALRSKKMEIVWQEGMMRYWIEDGLQIEIQLETSRDERWEEEEEEDWAKKRNFSLITAVHLKAWSHRREVQHLLRARQWSGRERRQDDEPYQTSAQLDDVQQ